MDSSPNQSPMTAVAMSGGVDSSAVAAILKERGFPVVGLTMQLWNQRRLPELVRLPRQAPLQYRAPSSTRTPTVVIMNGLERL